MAIRLSKNLQSIKTEEDKTKVENGFEVSGSAGQSYDLEDIEKSKNRTATDYQLILHNIERWGGAEEGDIGFNEKEDEIGISKVDYKKYLLEDECNKPISSSNSGISLKRPVVIWEEGSEDIRTEDEIYSLSKEIEHLKSELISLKSRKVTDVCDVDRLDHLTTVKAVMDYVDLMHEGFRISPPDEKNPYGYTLVCGDGAMIYNSTLDVPGNVRIEDGAFIIGG